MKKGHHKGKRHYSGKELLELRKAKREEYEKQFVEQAERKKEDREFLMKTIRCYSPDILCGFKIPH